MTTWGEVTGVYYDPEEAGWMWGNGEEKQKGKGYWQLDAVIGARAVELVKRKRKQYVELVKRHGRGNLMVVLNHPLTTRSTRVEAEGGIRELLFRAKICEYWWTSVS